MRRYTINLIIIVLLTFCGSKVIVDLNPDLRTVTSLYDEPLNNLSNLSLSAVDINDGWVTMSETEISPWYGATIKLTHNG